MKWKHIYPDTKHGAHRVVDRFLWRPLRLGDETRWLERAAVIQLFRRTESYWNRGGHWVDWKWAEAPVENLSITPGDPRLLPATISKGPGETLTVTSPGAAFEDRAPIPKVSAA